MPDITANAPDGTKHVFPDGTDPAVIDRVMKQYITGAKPATTPDIGNQAGSYQTRRGGPVLNTNQTPIQAGTAAFEGAFGVKDPQSIADALKQAGVGLGGMVKGSYKEWKEGLDKETPGTGAIPPTPWLPSGLQAKYNPLNYLTTAGAAFMTPFEFGARGIEGIASGLEGSARDIDIGLNTGDKRSIVAGIGSLIGTKAQMKAGEKIAQKLTPVQDFGEKVSESGRLLKQMDAINKGQVQVVNEHVKKPLAALDNAVNQEIGRHVKAAIDADNAQMQATGSQVGTVNATKAVEAAQNKLNSMSGITFAPNLADMLMDAGRPMTLSEAKQLTTDVGRTAAALTRQGNLRQAAVMNTLYDGLHDASQARANELGTGKSWQHYIDLTRSWKDMQEGLAGELTDEPVHAKVMNKLIDPTRATEWNELKDEMQKRGIDTTNFEKARKYAQDMSGLIATTGNIFFGKLKAMIQHPFTAAPAAIGASEVGHLTGIPGLGFVLPIIAAGKVAGLLDTAKMNELLKEINKAVPPEAGRATEALPPPMEPQKGSQPQNPPMAGRDIFRGNKPPTPAGYKGGINASGLEASTQPISDARTIDSLSSQIATMWEKLRNAGKGISSEEKSALEKQIGDYQQRLDELRGSSKVMSQQEVEEFRDLQDKQETEERARKIQQAKARKNKKP